jgi:hypothetical protein
MLGIWTDSLCPCLQCRWSLPLHGLQFCSEGLKIIFHFGLCGCTAAGNGFWWGTDPCSNTKSS